MAEEAQIKANMEEEINKLKNPVSLNLKNINLPFKNKINLNESVLSEKYGSMNSARVVVDGDLKE